MQPRAYYNENDPFAAAWLRELIKADLIAQGEVDERSIRDVQSSDLDGFTQHHFFAGIGGWSHALRQAGWPDDRPVWTGSCPCQSFSVAGQRRGFSDERHLWPEFFRLIRESCPERILGEQVASGDGLAWLDLVHDDLEGEGYAVGALDTCAAGFGAPHIRQRLYWVAHTAESRRPEAGEYGSRSSLLSTRSAERSRVTGPSDDGGVVDSPSEQVGIPRRARQPRESFWSACDWLPCTDGKSRPVEPGTFPLAHGIVNRVGLLRGYGNALVAPQAQAFIEAYMSLL